MRITEGDIVRAAARLAPVVHRTPVVRSRSLDALAGMELYLKAENLQRAGSFKIRGAYNKIAQLPPRARERGVIAYSSGNHAQGVALAARLLGVPATIVVPETIIPAKRAATEAYGAELVYAGTTSSERRDHAEKLAAERQLDLVAPYDDPAIMAGQGTVALELLEDSPDIDTLVVPIGGGGLMSGCAVLARARRPKARILGVEPEGGDDTRRSLQAKQRVRIPPPQTIADGLRAVEPGELTFEVIRELVDDIVLVSDAEIRQAVRLLLERTKLLVEPSGAVGLAAALAGKLPHGATPGIVLSGGNIDPSTLREILGGD
jgi:threo-3-hydroxy-L-aspartate ammonia-lyase